MGKLKSYIDSDKVTVEWTCVCGTSHEVIIVGGHMGHQPDEYCHCSREAEAAFNSRCIGCNRPVQVRIR